MPPIGRFVPNFAQTQIGPWNTISKSLVVMGLYFVNICYTVYFDHTVQEIVVLFLGRFLDYHNSLDNFLSGVSTDVTCKVWCKSLKLSRRSVKK